MKPFGIDFTSHPHVSEAEARQYGEKEEAFAYFAASNEAEKRAQERAQPKNDANNKVYMALYLPLMQDTKRHEIGGVLGHRVPPQSRYIRKSAATNSSLRQLLCHDPAKTKLADSVY